MKKLLLLLAASAAVSSVQAQYARPHLDESKFLRKIKQAPESANFVPATGHSAAKTTATTPFITENFGTGTTSALPTGWTAGSYSGTGTWKWANAAMTGTYNIGTLAAPATTTDGWMVYDSDVIGDPSGMPSGWLQSPVYNCTGHSSVRLSFYEKFRRFQDSCVVWVSNSASPTWAAGTYTSFPVYANNNLDNNTTTDPNPKKISLNISSVAGGSSTVSLRFVYYCYYAGGAFNWLVDDVALAELDPTDIGIASSFMYEDEPSLSYDGSIFNTPLRFVDSVSPVTLLSNYGNLAATGVSLTAQIYQGSTSVYSQTSTYPSLAVNAVDTVIEFPPYLPTAIGNYTCTINATVAADADLTNNIDTSIKFAVTDSIWQQNAGLITGGYYLHRNTAPITSYMYGTRFDVPPTSVGDTVSGFGVAFNSASTATNSGGKVSVQLYSHPSGATGWTFVGSSYARAVVAADISSSTSTTWAYFKADNTTPLVMAPDMNYAAMIQIEGVTTSLLVNATTRPNATGYSGYFGQSDSSNNSGGQDFAPLTNATGMGAVPMVRVYFANVPVGINDINASLYNIGNAFPNPANSAVTVPFTMSENAAVTVTLSNVVGQVISTQTIQAQGGVANKATFATATLPSGVYMYTVMVNGQQKTGRVSITH